MVEIVIVVSEWLGLTEGQKHPIEMKWCEPVLSCHPPLSQCRWGGCIAIYWPYWFVAGYLELEVSSVLLGVLLWPDFWRLVDAAFFNVLAPSHFVMGKQLHDMIWPFGGVALRPWSFSCLASALVDFKSRPIRCGWGDLKNIWSQWKIIPQACLQYSVSRH